MTGEVLIPLAAGYCGGSVLSPDSQPYLQVH